MYSEIRLLVKEDKMYILGKKSQDAYGLLCQPHNIGSMAIAFSNVDLTYLKDLSMVKQAIDDCLNVDGLVYNSRKLQTIIMGLIQLLDINANELWFFEIERSRLQEIDRKLAQTFPRKEELSAALTGILSHLESLIQFQEDLKKMLSELSLAGKKGSGHASSAQILRRLFREFPAICNSCFGTGGYMLVDVDEQGEVRTEMLDRDMSNAFRAILEPESPPLEYNDINDNKVISEFHVLSDVKMCVMFDLIEGLRRSDFFAQCATCKTFFLTSDKRLAYCFNEACRSDVSRMRRRQKKIHGDPVLEEAFRYKNVMGSRYLRTCNAAHVKPSNKNVSHEEYETWMELFRESRNVYEQKKAEAILRCDSQEAINKIEEEFLARIRPTGYKPHSPSKKATAHNAS